MWNKFHSSSILIFPHKIQAKLWAQMCIVHFRRRFWAHDLTKKRPRFEFFFFCFLQNFLRYPRHNSTLKKEGHSDFFFYRANILLFYASSRERESEVDQRGREKVNAKNDHGLSFVQTKAPPFSAHHGEQKKKLWFEFCLIKKNLDHFWVFLRKKARREDLLLKAFSKKSNSFFVFRTSPIVVCSCSLKGSSVASDSEGFKKSHEFVHCYHWWWGENWSVTKSFCIEASLHFWCFGFICYFGHLFALRITFYWKTLIPKALGPQHLPWITLLRDLLICFQLGNFHIIN